MVAKKIAVVSHERCVACGACQKVCPRNAISIIKGSYAQPDEKFCIGCGLCAKTCPADCIKITMKSGETNA